MGSGPKAWLRNVLATISSFSPRARKRRAQLLAPSFAGPIGLPLVSTCQLLLRTHFVDRRLNLHGSAASLLVRVHCFCTRLPIGLTINMKAHQMQKQQQYETKYVFASICSQTKRGGRITTATSGLVVCGLAIACVGDVVTYKDGSEAVIIDGAGLLATSHGKPFALVGSRLSNGDSITESLQDHGITVQDGESVPGLFDPEYVPPAPPPSFRLAVRGASTARGGVLRTPSAQWEVSQALGKAGAVGDLIYYPDGSTARIVEGIGLINHPDCEPLAFVGSALENGDAITDSPERDGIACSLTFVVVRPELEGLA